MRNKITLVQDRYHNAFLDSKVCIIFVDIVVHGFRNRNFHIVTIFTKALKFCRPRYFVSNLDEGNLDEGG